MLAAVVGMHQMMLLRGSGVEEQCDSENNEVEQAGDDEDDTCLGLCVSDFL